MIPFRFAGRRGGVFGAYHPSASNGLAEHGILLCNPFGQEAIRSHRMFRVLADRFARGGKPSLRFDYYGTGDSDGDDEELSVDQCADDVLAADAELRRRSGCTNVSWMGLRFGATVAAIASSRAAFPPDALILWDPVVAGGDWLLELAASHRRALDQAYDVPPPARGSAAVTPAGCPLSEALGFPVTEALRAEFAALDSTSFNTARCRRLIYLIGHHEGKMKHLEETRGDQGGFTSWHSVAESDWNSDEAMNASIVPADVVAIAVQELSCGR